MAAKNNRHLQFICLLACFLFAFAVSADPLLHSHDHDEGYQIECQFCKNDVPGSLNYTLADRFSYLSISYSFEIAEGAVSTVSPSYSSRAPPKI